MRIVNFFLLSTAIVILTGSTCYQADPLPPLLGKPAFTNAGLAPKKEYDGYIEAAHLTWRPPNTDSISVSYYTLMKMLPGDTIFDVFSLSQYIPADTLNFFDPLDPAVFPDARYSLSAKSIYYRIYAVDSLGRQSSISDPCTLLIAPQPYDDRFDQNYCIFWESDMGGSSVNSYAHVWNENIGDNWTSEKVWKFGNPENPAQFNTCPPDSLKPLYSGLWYYALFASASDTRSIKIGYFNVP